MESLHIFDLLLTQAERRRGGIVLLLEKMAECWNGEKRIEWNILESWSTTKVVASERREGEGFSATEEEFTICRWQLSFKGETSPFSLSFGAFIPIIVSITIFPVSQHWWLFCGGNRAPVWIDKETIHDNICHVFTPADTEKYKNLRHKIIKIQRYLLMCRLAQLAGRPHKLTWPKNLVLKTCMLGFPRHSRQKCCKRSFLRQKRAVLASNVRSVRSYEAVFPDH